MRHLLFEQASTYNIAILVKAAAFKQQEILSNYVDPLVKLGLSKSSMIGFTLDYDDTGKAPVKFIKAYLDKLLPALASLGVEYLYVTDTAYFKVLTKQATAERHLGYVLPCAITGYETMKVVLGINYQALIYNPDLQSKLDMSLDKLASSVGGCTAVLGSGIIHSALYPEGTESIANALEKLHAYPRLSCDIETFSLRFNEAGIGTIAFGLDQHNGVAFACDYQEVFDKDGSLSDHPEVHNIDIAAYAGFATPNQEVRALLKQFFETYQGELTWHNATFDCKCLIYTLWMKHDLDTEGLLTGLEVMTRNFQDTKIIAYLATNSTAGNVLGLKPLAHEFAGNWAVDEIKDIRKIHLKDLLQYNLVDCLSTLYVKDKYYPIMVNDQQEELYYSLMLPSLKVIIQMELTGMSMDAEKIQQAKKELEEQQQEYLDVIRNSSIIKVFDLLVQRTAMVKANAKLKTKQHPIEKYKDVVFNPNSGPQLQQLLYEQMCLPVLDYTDTKQPATGGDTLEKLIHHTTNQAYKDILTALIGLSKVDKILTSFIPAFEKAIPKADGRVYLHGNFNLGSVVSGRMSGSKPNLQQIPSGSKYGKTIKKCFSAPDGWILAGADFASLEAMVGALVTKDPAKISIYTDGYDSHSFNAYGYWKDKMPLITNGINNINSIVGNIYRVEYTDGTVDYLSETGVKDAGITNYRL